MQAHIKLRLMAMQQLATMPAKARQELGRVSADTLARYESRRALNQPFPKREYPTGSNTCHGWYHGAGDGFAWRAMSYETRVELCKASKRLAEPGGYFECGMANARTDPYEDAKLGQRRYNGKWRARGVPAQVGYMLRVAAGIENN